MPYENVYLPWGTPTEAFWTHSQSAQTGSDQPTHEIATPLTIRRAIHHRPHHAVTLATALVDALTQHHTPDSPALTEANQLLQEADHAAAAADWTAAMTDRATRYEAHARTTYGPDSHQAAQWAQLRQSISGPDPWGAATQLSLCAARVHQAAGDLRAARELTAAAAQTQPRAADPESHQAELDALRSALAL